MTAQNAKKSVLGIEVLHVHNDLEQNVPCKFVESNDSAEDSSVVYWFRCNVCPTQIGIKLSPQKVKEKES